MNEDKVREALKLMEYICIISLHEKGFWQADVYEDGNDTQELPVWFCTGKKNEDMFGVITKASKQYPGISFHQGITGICDDCGEEYISHETKCECGGTISDPY